MGAITYTGVPDAKSSVIRILVVEGMDPALTKHEFSINVVACTSVCVDASMSDNMFA